MRIKFRVREKHKAVDTHTVKGGDSAREEEERQLRRFQTPAKEKSVDDIRLRRYSEFQGATYNSPRVQDIFLYQIATVNQHRQLLVVKLVGGNVWGIVINKGPCLWWLFLHLTMKILQDNAGALINFEVLDLFKSRGASKDPTRVIAPISRSEYKVYDYLVETEVCNQSRETVDEFSDKSKKFKLAKSEVLNIINIRPVSIVALEAIIEQLDTRGINSDELVELVKEVLPLPPVPEADEELVEKNEEKKTADDKS